jgi:DNA-directed RNA polymerase specialized sigma24 family protein
VRVASRRKRDADRRDRYCRHTALNSTEIIDPQLSPLDLLCYHEDRSRLNKAIDQLPDCQRRAIRARFYAYEDTALSQSAANSAMHRARKNLRRLLNELRSREKIR